MSVPSIEKLTALEPWTVVGVRAGDLLDCLASAADAVTEAKVAAASESRTEYGVMTDVGWVPEHRGIKYARQQRTIRFRVSEPVEIDHWTYADHRHPAEGCTFCADQVLRGEQPRTTKAAVSAALSAAPQPEPDLVTAAGGFCVPLFPQSDGSVKVGRATTPEPDDGCAECTESGTQDCGAGCKPEPPASDDPEWAQAKADLERSLAETSAEHSRARAQVPPASDEPDDQSDSPNVGSPADEAASDEPARCEHGETGAHYFSGTNEFGYGSTSIGCPGPAASGTPDGGR